jgi:hypothetical protein
LQRKSGECKTKLDDDCARAEMITLEIGEEGITQSGEVFGGNLVQIVGYLHEDQISWIPFKGQLRTFVLNVCAAKSLAAGGASGLWRRTLQVAQESGYDKWRIADKSEVLVGILATGERQFTECWKSWSHEFARSSEALSGARPKTSSADMSAWISAIVCPEYER